MNYIFKVLVFILYSISASSAGSRIFVNIIYRHGARTPGYFYHGDPNQNQEVFKKLGPGKLTDRGKEEHIKLGTWLHERFPELLTDPSVVHVQSTAVERVKESVKCNLAAMSHGSHTKDSDGVKCTTRVPIKVVPTDEDKVLTGLASCPAYKKEYSKLMDEEQKKREKKFKHMFDLVQKNTGVDKSELNIKYIHKIYDALRVEKEDYSLVLPDWTNPIYPDLLKEATILRMTLATWNDKLKRLGEGLLLQEMIDSMEKKTNGKNHLNANIYAAHDFAIVNTLNTLGVYDQKHLPPFASCILLELWEESKGKYSVELYYKKSPNSKAEKLNPLKCGSPCSLETFKSKCSQFFPEDWDKECHSEASSSHSGHKTQTH